MEIKYELYHGDCLEWMPKLIKKGVKVGLVLTDLPYGTTQCVWDSVIPFEPMWDCLRDLVGKRCAVVLFGSQPFTSALVMSNPKWFKYEIVWDKVNKYTGALNANVMPLKRHENILIFSDGVTTFNKQMRKGSAYTSVKTTGHGRHTRYGETVEHRTTINDGNHNPCSIIEIQGDVKTEIGLHPTQKPVALLEYLIKTYTNPGDTVLDFCMGSGSTGEACANTGRNFIGIELYPLLDRPIDKKENPDNFGIAQSRVEKAYRRANGLPKLGAPTDSFDLPLFSN